MVSIEKGGGEDRESPELSGSLSSRSGRGRDPMSSLLGVGDGELLLYSSSVRGAGRESGSFVS